MTKMTQAQISDAMDVAAQEAELAADAGDHAAFEAANREFQDLRIRLLYS